MKTLWERFLERVNETRSPAAVAPSLQAQARFERYVEMLRDESTRQNLTKLLDDDAMLDSHLCDSWTLIHADVLRGTCADLGSGAGVPGLLCGIFESRPWVLIESERRKAEFLSRCAEALELTNVAVVPARAELAVPRLNALVPETFVSRAVGKVWEQEDWISGCSTWNRLVLLKGPSWPEEWKLFKLKRPKSRLSVVSEHHYESWVEKKPRVLVTIERNKNKSTR